MLLHSKVISLLVFSFILQCSSVPEKSKVLKVTEINSSENTSLTDVSALLEQYASLNQISVLNWPEFEYQPKVSFRIAHCNNQIWLKYYVEEKSIRAETTKTNGSVYLDSCVEFFFDPKQNENYYNFEFNCIGTTHLAYRAKGAKSTYVAPSIIEKEIQVKSSLGATKFKEKTGKHTWEMTIIIPATSLIHDPNIQLKGLSSKANFYKCGDKTADPHYLSWNAISSKKPNFHQPKFFGELIFE